MRERIETIHVSADASYQVLTPAPHLLWSEMHSALHFNGDDFMVHAEELTDDLLQDLLDCGGQGGQGEQTENVKFVLRHHSVKCDEALARDYLRGYGAWDDELADHDKNLERLVWLTGCGLREDDYAHFSSY